MTATLSDDSVLATHFGADASKLKKVITTANSQAMGERMILMPQELNSDLTVDDIRALIVDVSKKHNAVVIVPSFKAAEYWKKYADQLLSGDEVAPGVEKLRSAHVGLTVLVNRYDGIDLPGSACRLLAIVDLPESASLIDRVDVPILGDSKVGLRRQVQRVEQGMGRGVRSVDDYCAVLLVGARLVERILSSAGQEMLTFAAKAQLDLSKRLAKQMSGATADDIKLVIERCLSRDKSWVAAARKCLIGLPKVSDLKFESSLVQAKLASDLIRDGEYKKASKIVEDAANAEVNNNIKGWLKVRLAQSTNFYDRANAQKILQTAHKLNRQVTRPIDGVSYEKLAPAKFAQILAVQSYFRSLLEAPERILAVQSIVDALIFAPETADKFEQAFMDVGRVLGITSQRPEKQLGEGPDNLWVLRDGRFLLIECKNGSVSEQGISKAELGQLDQATTWFGNKYGADATFTPIIVHPKHHLGPGASEIPGLRIVSQKQLDDLKKALRSFVKEIADQSHLNSDEKVKGALLMHNFTESQFLNAYTRKPGK